MNNETIEVKEEEENMVRELPKECGECEDAGFGVKCSSCKHYEQRLKYFSGG